MEMVHFPARQGLDWRKWPRARWRAPGQCQPM